MDNRLRENGLAELGQQLAAWLPGGHIGLCVDSVDIHVFIENAGLGSDFEEFAFVGREIGIGGDGVYFHFFDWHGGPLQRAAIFCLNGVQGKGPDV